LLLQICELAEDERPLGYYSAQSYMTIHVVDTVSAL
jgi:hypothetical protein